MKQLTGKCSCGSVSYEVDGEPLVTQACHCLDCQRTTGSAFVIHTVICEEDFVITGKTRMGIVPTGSGTGCELHSCASCGVIVWVRYRYHQVPVIAIRAGTLKDPRSVSPQAHIFVSRKLPWVVLPTDVPSFQKGIERSEVWSKKSLERYEKLSRLN